MSWVESFHFIRPLWLLALLPWLALAIRARRRTGDDVRWTRVIDPALLRALTPSGGETRRTRLDQFTIWAALFGGVIGIVALAGPSWRYQPAPVFQTSQSRVIVMDLSESMSAQDLAPDRLTRARFTALDLIDALPDGRIGVVAFAGTAHSVVPLTADHRTVRHLVSTLTPALMPVPGSNIAAGLRQAETLLSQGDAWNGDLVLLTDSKPDAAALSVARQLAGQGYSLSVIGFGTADGAPIPSTRGGWVHGRDGRMSLARLDEDGLRQLAAGGGGRYLRMPAQAVTPQQLGLSNAARPAHGADAQDQETLQWDDAGPWLLLPLLPLMLLAFRRGAPWLACVLLLLAPLPRADAFELAELWKNADQRGYDLLQSNEAALAQDTFANQRWKGIAAYRAGDFSAAADAFANPQTADDAYNLGNALARSGDLDGATDAYANALEMNPQHSDAAFNKQLIDQLKNQQQQDGEAGDQGQDGQSDDQPPRSGDQQADSSESQSGTQPQSDPQQNNAPREDPAATDDRQSATADEADKPGESSEEPSEAEASEPTSPPQPDDAQAGQEADGNPTAEEQAAVQQWLRRVPDDPGGLLRNKFLLEQQRRQAQRQGDSDG